MKELGALLLIAGALVGAYLIWKKLNPDDESKADADMAAAVASGDLRKVKEAYENSAMVKARSGVWAAHTYDDTPDGRGAWARVMITMDALIAAKGNAAATAALTRPRKPAGNEFVNLDAPSLLLHRAGDSALGNTFIPEGEAAYQEVMRGAVLIYPGIYASPANKARFDAARSTVGAPPERIAENTARAAENAARDADRRLRATDAAAREAYRNRIRAEYAARGARGVAPLRLLEAQWAYEDSVRPGSGAI